MRATIRELNIRRQTQLSLDEIAKMGRPVLAGWVRHYGRFYPSALRRKLCTLDHFLVRWAKRKYLRLRGHHEHAWAWLDRVKTRHPSLFAHWMAGSVVG